jgi:hypothetical protein
MKRLLILSLTVLAVAVARPTQAADIRIDLSNLVGTTAGNWNNISNLTGLTSNLIDFPTGAATGVSINGAGSTWQDFFGDNNGTFPNRDWLIQPATKDGAGLQSGLTGTYLFSGLVDSSYKIEVVTARTTFDYLNTITVNGGLANRTELGTAVVTPWRSTSDGLTPGNWLIWDNIAPLNGNIRITDVAGPSTLGMINAIRIVTAAVPEPASFVMGGTAMLLGLVVAGLRRLRRRAL